MNALLKWISAIAAFLCAAHASLAQCEMQDVSEPSLQGGVLYESQNGWYMPTHGTVRILLVLAEVNYTVPGVDPTPPEGTAMWPAHQLPVWITSTTPMEYLFDWEEPTGTAGGMLTRYFQDASSGNFTLLADYLLAPDNGGVFQVNSATT